MTNPSRESLSIVYQKEWLHQSDYDAVNSCFAYKVTMAGFGDVFGSVSGWLKVIELLLTFITLIIHRYSGQILCQVLEIF